MASLSRLIPVSQPCRLLNSRLAVDFQQKIKDFNLGEYVFAVVFTDKCIQSQTKTMQFANQPESEPQTTPLEAAVKSNQDAGLIESSEVSNAE